MLSRDARFNARTGRLGRRIICAKGRCPPKKMRSRQKYFSGCIGRCAGSHFFKAISCIERPRFLGRERAHPDLAGPVGPPSGEFDPPAVGVEGQGVTLPILSPKVAVEASRRSAAGDRGPRSFFQHWFPSRCHGCATGTTRSLCSTHQRLCPIQRQAHPSLRLQPGCRTSAWRDVAGHSGRDCAPDVCLPT